MIHLIKNGIYVSIYVKILDKLFETGIGAGLLRNLFFKSIELNIVCADFVTNGSLAIAWHTFNEYGRTQFEPKIYHINRVSDPALIFGMYSSNEFILLHHSLENSCEDSKVFAFIRDIKLYYISFHFICFINAM